MQMQCGKNKLTGNSTITVDGSDLDLLVKALWTEQLRYTRLIKEFDAPEKQYNLMDGVYAGWLEHLPRVTNMYERLRTVLNQD